MVDEQSFKSVWRNFVTGVAIVTTIESNGLIHGMTANSIASISLNPPLVMASVGYDRESNKLIKRTGKFAISILSDKQESAALYYSSSRDPNLYIDGEWIRNCTRLFIIHGMPYRKTLRGRRSYHLHRIH